MSSIILFQSSFPEISLPGNPFEDWQGIIILGLIIALVAATVWIAIPSISMPPKGAEEWKIMLVVWVTAFVCFIPPAGAASIGTEFLPFIQRVNQAESDFNDYYGFNHISGFPSSPGEEGKEVEVYFGEVEENDDEPVQWAECIITSDNSRYLPIKCKTEEDGEMVEVSDPDTFEYYMFEHEDESWFS